MRGDDGLLVAGEDMDVIVDDWINLEVGEDNDCRIDMRDGRINIYADTVRMIDNGTSWTGRTGQVVTDIDTEEVTVVSDVDNNYVYYVTFDHVTSVSYHYSRNGLVCN